MISTSSFYIDFEFNGMGGQLISFGIVNEDRDCGRYFIFTDLEEKMKQHKETLDPWVAENVMPFLETEFTKNHPSIPTFKGSTVEIQAELQKYLLSLKGDSDSVNGHFQADWPVDIAYLSNLFITGPGTMIQLHGYSAEIHRIDSYPSTNPNYQQHNALCDALALKDKMDELMSDFIGSTDTPSNKSE